jgi:hypothetical protein
MTGIAISPAAKTIFMLMVKSWWSGWRALAKVPPALGFSIQ